MQQGRGRGRTRVFTACGRLGLVLGLVLGLALGASMGGCSGRGGGAIATKSRRLAGPPGSKQTKKAKGAKDAKGAKGAPAATRLTPYEFIERRLALLQCPPPGVTPKAGQITLPPPPFSEGIWKCSQCHADMEPKPRRKLDGMHSNIKLDHGPRERWCYDCHNPKNRDVLRLASGKTVSFAKSYLLCGQCHGPKLRDWRLGIHGKRFGKWNGPRCNLLCAHCHNPHSPRFKPVKPLPPPKPPIDIR